MVDDESETCLAKLNKWFSFNVSYLKYLLYWQLLDENKFKKHRGIIIWGVGKS